MLYLASRSPRRRELLAQIAVGFELLDVDVEERRMPGESAAGYVERVALDKALAAQGSAGIGADDWILAADTEVILDDEVFGKPADAGAAAAMLARLSGREHEVVSAVWLLGHSRHEHAVCHSKVRFTTLARADIDAYVASGEPFGKAGGYAIQGRAAGFIEHLCGSYSGVVGLPLFETATLLRHCGLI